MGWDRDSSQPKVLVAGWAQGTQGTQGLCSCHTTVREKGQQGHQQPLCEGGGQGGSPGSRAGRRPGGEGQRPPLQPSAPSWTSGRSSQTLTTAGRSAAAGQPGRGEQGVTDTAPAQEGSSNMSETQTPAEHKHPSLQNHPSSHTWLNSPRAKRPKVHSRDTRGPLPWQGCAG